MLAGASDPVAAPVIIRVNRSNDERNACQCSRSPTWRIASPSRPRQPEPGRGELVDALQVADGVRQQPRQRRAEHEVVDGRRCDRSRTCSSIQPELRLAEHEVRAVVQDPAVPRVDHHEPGGAEVPAEAEPHALAAVGLGVGPVREGGQQRPGVAVGGHDLLVVGVGRELVGGQVAQVLVDPVRRERRPDPLPPPRLLAPSPCARPPRCSSRRARRGRRRSSRWARTRAASAPPGRSTSRGRGPTYSSNPTISSSGHSGCRSRRPAMRRRFCGVSSSA